MNLSSLWACYHSSFIKVRSVTLKSRSKSFALLICARMMRVTVLSRSARLAQNLSLGQTPRFKTKHHCYVIQEQNLLSPFSTEIQHPRMEQLSIWRITRSSTSLPRLVEVQPALSGSIPQIGPMCPKIGALAPFLLAPVLKTHTGRTS